MFCTKCGCAHSDGAAFCTQCGASLTLKEPAGEAPKAKTPITKAEYFTNHCSAIAQKKRKTIKTLSIVSLAIQGILNIAMILYLVAFAHALQQSALFKGGAESVHTVIVFLLCFTAASFGFTIWGMKKNSTGFFAWAILFAFVSATFGSNVFGSLALRQLIALGTLAIYIAITVLNYQNNKEYKMYAGGNCTQ